MIGRYKTNNSIFSESFFNYLKRTKLNANEKSDNKDIKNSNFYIENMLELSNLLFLNNLQNSLLNKNKLINSYLNYLANLKKTPKINKFDNSTGDKELDELIKAAGYEYDGKQDIFYSTINPWQRKFGFCKLYDNAAAPTGMIIDCEPVAFEYEGKEWLIEFWKGQYDLTTGCEIGIYVLEKKDLLIRERILGNFYRSASDAELLQMSYTLKKNNVELFKREGTHWWLTGFKLGEFSEPKELSVDISITLKSTNMRTAFVQSLEKVGYPSDKISINNNTVSFVFDKPYSKQPFTRSETSDFLIQRKNEELCKEYQSITEGYNNFPDKLKVIKEKAPNLYEKVISIGKTKKVFEYYEVIRNFID